ncbi:MAG: LamG domain-containing protein, partial [Bryobacteraceae bacterium]
MKLVFFGLIAVSVLAPIHMRAASKPAEAGTVGSWSFDETDGASAREAVTNSTAKIDGYFKRMAGVSGSALRFDGYTTGLVWKAKDAPHVPSAFSVEAWIAVGSYPWNWLPIVEQRREDQAGYSFGIDSFGHFGLELAINGEWQRVLSKAQLPLRKWAQVSATFGPNHVLTLYLNGKQAGILTMDGNWEPAYREELRIGRVRSPQLPAQWIHPKYPVWYSFDGLLDEIRIFDHSLGGEEVGRRFETVHAPTAQVLPWPVLPSGPPGKGRFGAYYAHFAYEDIWDDPRRVGA